MINYIVVEGSHKNPNEISTLDENTKSILPEISSISSKTWNPFCLSIFLFVLSISIHIGSHLYFSL